MLPVGNYSYEIRLHGELVAFENGRLDPAMIIASRRSADGLSRHQVEATLNADHHVYRVSLSYWSSLFRRKASYEAAEDNLRGRISGLAGHNEIVVKLGRFREVDVGGFLIFRALIIDHVRLRGDQRWTGRVAVIDANTLAAASIKQNCAWQNRSEHSWIYEPGMGDAEQIELDEAGRIVRRRDNRGVTAELMIAGTDR
jgi:hypothetical protein